MSCDNVLQSESLWLRDNDPARNHVAIYSVIFMICNPGKRIMGHDVDVDVDVDMELC